jgi:hypothetical protein
VTLPHVSDPANPNPVEPPRAATHLPRPTAWPMLLAAGVTMLMAGLITNPIFAVAGIVAVGIALRGWFEEVRHESTE